MSVSSHFLFVLVSGNNSERVHIEMKVYHKKRDCRMSLRKRGKQQQCRRKIMWENGKFCNKGNKIFCRTPRSRERSQYHYGLQRVDEQCPGHPHKHVSSSGSLCYMDGNSAATYRRSRGRCHPGNSEFSVVFPWKHSL